MPITLCLLLEAARTGGGGRNVSCANNFNHNMCVFTEFNASSSCINIMARGVTDTEKPIILAAHNRLRAAVQAGEYASRGLPAAVSLPPLQWDDELATVAQRWADQCLAYKRDMRGE